MLAAAIALTLLAHLDGGSVAGSFRHGQWSGECFRDGTLRGMTDEICRGRWSGNVDITFERDADSLTVSVSPRTPPSSRCSESLSVPADRLRKRDRATQLIGAIRKAVQQIGAKCGLPLHLTPFDLSDLQATLHETDGLTHVR